MAQPIIFKITDAGKLAALNAGTASPKIKINLTQVAVSAEKHVITGSETELTTEIKRFSIISGDVHVSSNTLRFTGSMTVDEITPIYQVGLLTDDGGLFAIAASNTAPLFNMHPDITFVIGFGLSLNEVEVGSVSVTTDPNGALSVVIMEQHLAAPDPHPQYLNAQRFVQFLELAYPYGHPYWTHNKSNPKTLFDAMFGYETHWRRLEGIGLVAVKDGDVYIGQPMITLGQRGMTELATDERPQAYPIYTSYLFERYDPSAVIETVWRVIANKTSVNEGDAIRFTVTANNLPDGQILDWSIKEGALNSANNDITTVDKSDSGTTILNNGQAIINFITSPDENLEELQKHVRLTVGAPASLSINVPINDAGHNEVAIHISQSTNDGIDLAEYYKQQSGAYPLVTDKLRFIVDSGVDILAPNTSTPAITNGSKWPIGGDKPIIENRGRILGHGGNGGLGAALLNGYDNHNAASLGDELVATAGGNGGTAIKGNLLVENYSVIAGGGGGGGGNGAYRLKYDGNFQVYMGSDSSGGGGAPFGEAFYNRTHIDSWFAEPTSTPAGISNLKEIFRVAETAVDGVNDSISNISFSSEQQKWIANYLRNTETNYSKDPSAAVFLDSIGVDKTQVNTPFAIAKPIPKTGYMSAADVKLSSAVFNDPHTYIVDVWTAGNSPTYRLSLPMYNPFNGELLTGGKGGLGFAAVNSFINERAYLSFKGKSYESFMRAGAGGNIGENGGDGKLTHVSSFVAGTASTFEILPISELPENASIKTSFPAKGGLAGLIKEGSVTITNFGSGTTKGR